MKYRVTLFKEMDGAKPVEEIETDEYTTDKGELTFRTKITKIDVVTRTDIGTYAAGTWRSVKMVNPV